jgi:hypothetical protein
LIDAINVCFSLDWDEKLKEEAIAYRDKYLRKNE